MRTVRATFVPRIVSGKRQVSIGATPADDAELSRVVSPGAVSRYRKPVLIQVEKKTIQDQQITFTLAGRAFAASPGLQFGSAVVTGEVWTGRLDQCWGAYGISGNLPVCLLLTSGPGTLTPDKPFPKRDAGAKVHQIRLSTLGIASMQASGVSTTLRCGEWTGSMMSMRASNRGMTLIRGCSGSRRSPNSSCAASGTRSHANGTANGLNCNTCWTVCWRDAALSGS
jgi:hypothetical protein